MSPVPESENSHFHTLSGENGEIYTIESITQGTVDITNIDLRNIQSISISNLHIPDDQFGHKKYDIKISIHQNPGNDQSDYPSPLFSVQLNSSSKNNAQNNREDVDHGGEVNYDDSYDEDYGVYDDSYYEGYDDHDKEGADDNNNSQTFAINTNFYKYYQKPKLKNLAGTIPTVQKNDPPHGFSLAEIQSIDDLWSRIQEQDPMSYAVSEVKMYTASSIIVKDNVTGLNIDIASSPAINGPGIITLKLSPSFLSTTREFSITIHTRNTNYDSIKDRLINGQANIWEIFEELDTINIVTMETTSNDGTGNFSIEIIQIEELQTDEGDNPRISIEVKEGSQADIVPRDISSFISLEFENEDGKKDFLHFLVMKLVSTYTYGYPLSQFYREILEQYKDNLINQEDTKISTRPLYISFFSETNRYQDAEVHLRLIHGQYYIGAIEIFDEDLWVEYDGEENDAITITKQTPKAKLETDGPPEYNPVEYKVVVENSDGSGVMSPVISVNTKKGANYLIFYRHQNVDDPTPEDFIPYITFKNSKNEEITMPLAEFMQVDSHMGHDGNDQAKNELTNIFHEIAKYLYFAYINTPLEIDKFNREDDHDAITQREEDEQEKETSSNSDGPYIPNPRLPHKLPYQFIEEILLLMGINYQDLDIDFLVNRGIPEYYPFCILHEPPYQPPTYYPN